jgi:predicted Zn-dependent protease
VMHAGNSALAASESALERDDVADAADEARSARRWLPWAASPWQRLAEAQVVQGRGPEARASFRRAIEHDPEDWELWYELATASNGPARERALARARELNPRSEDVATLGRLER